MSEAHRSMWESIKEDNDAETANKAKKTGQAALMAAARLVKVAAMCGKLVESQNKRRKNK